MRRSALIAVIALSIVALIAGGLPGSAEAWRGHHHSHVGTNVALGLASFAVFNQLMGGFSYPWWAYERPIYVGTPTQIIYSPSPQVIYIEPAPALAPTTVQYPHGRYELRAYGARSEWIWIPAAPQPPPAAECRLSGRTARTPQGIVKVCD